MTEPAFVPVPVATLRRGGLPATDLYVLRENDKSPALFRSCSYAMRDTEWGELEKQGVGALWIREDDAKILDQNYEKNLSDLVHNGSLPIARKCEMVYNISYQWMQKVFETSNPEYVLQTSEQLVPHILDVIFSYHSAAHNFIIKASTDYELYSHSINVFLYGVALARRTLNLTQEEALTLYGPGFLLHDIGKLGIPKVYWDKEDSQIGDDWEEIRKHTTLGLQLIEDQMEISPESESIILYHHERLDGSGYPNGLAGEQIPIEARICAIADIFDTLSTHRSDQPRKTSFEALMNMKRDVPSKFDPDLFREFLYIFLPPEEPETNKFFPE